MAAAAALAGGHASAAASSQVALATDYREGEDVQVFSATHGGWVAATVQSVSLAPQPSVTVRYNDFPLQKTLPLEHLASLRRVPLSFGQAPPSQQAPPPSAWSPGAHVPAQWQVMVGQAQQVSPAGRAQQPPPLLQQQQSPPVARQVLHVGPGLAAAQPQQPQDLVQQQPQLQRQPRPAVRPVVSRAPAPSQRSLPAPTAGPRQQVVGSGDVGAAAVVFLDVDGVLHSLYGEEVFADSCCEALKRLLRLSGARVVLANQWAREGADRAELVNSVLRSMGLPPIYGSLAEVPSGRPEVEICRWLVAHPEVGRWVAIDDADLEVSNTPEAQRMRGRVVRTDKHVGLTLVDAERALAVLQAPPLVGGGVGGGPPASAAPALTDMERMRSEKSQVAEALHWEQLRNGGLAEMEKQFFGD